jgi:hypothetical protein
MSVVPDGLPEPGTIGLVAISGEVGRLIRMGQYIAEHPVKQWFRKDPNPTIEHAFIYLGDGKILEAEPGGARISDVTEYTATEEVYWCTAIAAKYAEFLPKVVSNAPHFVDTPYSFLDYFWLAAHRLHIWFPGLKLLIESTHHMICSQLCDWLYDLAGGHLFTDGRWDGDVMPLDLYELEESLRA